MFVELIELLRCPNDHEESPLIASSTRTVERHILDGILGCPVCNREFVIRDGETRFGEPLQRAGAEAPSTETGMRLAAFLELTDARGYAVLAGRFANHADAVARLAETPLVLLNAPDMPLPDVAARILVNGSIPFATGSMRGVALDASSGALASEAVRVLRIGGRLVGDASLALPDGVTEIVRDERAWIAEKSAAPESSAPRLVSLKRGGKP